MVLVYQMLNTQIMKKKNLNPYVSTLIRKNWFSLTFGALLIFLMVNKQFSFRLNLHNSQKPIEKPAIDKATVPPMTKKKKEVFTEEKTVVNNQSNQVSLNPFQGLRIISNAHISFNLKDAYQSLNQLDHQIVRSFVERFQSVAQIEKKKFEIPASIILAQAILFSQAGTSALNKKSNNYFGIFCESDESDGIWLDETTCYKKYESAWASFRAHSQYLGGKNFAMLKNLDPKDYQRWAKGLALQGYHNDVQYAQMLIEIIEKYQLNQLD